MIAGCQSSKSEPVMKNSSGQRGVQKGTRKWKGSTTKRSLSSHIHTSHSFISKKMRSAARNTRARCLLYFWRWQPALATFSSRQRTKIIPTCLDLKPDMSGIPTRRRVRWITPRRVCESALSSSVTRPTLFWKSLVRVFIGAHWGEAKIWAASQPDQTTGQRCERC